LRCESGSNSGTIRKRHSCIQPWNNAVAKEYHTLSKACYLQSYKNDPNAENGAHLFPPRNFFSNSVFLSQVGRILQLNNPVARLRFRKNSVGILFFARRFVPEKKNCDKLSLAVPADRA
jgi:hypothetical protein